MALLLGSLLALTFLMAGTVKGVIGLGLLSISLALLGLLLVIYALFSLGGPRLGLSPRGAVWVGPQLGGLSVLAVAPSLLGMLLG